MLQVSSQHKSVRHLFYLFAGIIVLSTSGVSSYPCALSIQDPRTTALCDSGFAALEKEEFDKARLLFDDVLALDEVSVKGLLGMGRVWLGLPARTHRALDYLNKAISLDADCVDAHYYCAIAHIRLSETDITSSNAREALKELDEIIILNPSHADAYYQRGNVFLGSFIELESARRAFRNQIDINPDHSGARFELLRLEMGTGDWNSAIAVAESTLVVDPDRWEVYPFLAGAYWKSDRLDDSMDTFERFFPVAPERERNLYMDLGHIITPREQREYSRLNEEGRKGYWMHYWTKRDPDPATAVNERLLEHFIRIAYSRVEFSKGGWPWDARGDLYIRYGEPDIRLEPNQAFAENFIEDDFAFYIRKRDLFLDLGLEPPGYKPDVFFTAPTIGKVTGGGTNERWIYWDRGFDLTFDNPVMNGRYLTEEDNTGTSHLAYALEVNIPTVSEEEEKIETFDPMDSVSTFKGSGGKTLVEYDFALMPDEFGAFRSVTGTYATIEVDVSIYSESWEPVARGGQDAKRLRTIPQMKIRGNELFVDATRLEAEPGTYRLTTLLMDPGTGRRATTEEMMDLPDYSGNELMISSILPAARIQPVDPGRVGPFIRNNLEVLPLPGRALQTDQPLYIYYEIYNLTKDPYGATDYRVDYSVAEAPDNLALVTRLFQGLASLVGAGRKRAVITSSSERSGIASDEKSFLEIDMSGLPPQTYELELRITNTLNGESASSFLLFRTLPPIE